MSTLPASIRAVGEDVVVDEEDSVEEEDEEDIVEVVEGITRTTKSKNGVAEVLVSCQSVGRWRINE